MTPLVEIPRLETIREAYQTELLESIEFYVSEMATMRRTKEITTEQNIRDAITGIIMDELTLINRYREELL
jgi:hypothetical protein